MLPTVNRIVTLSSRPVGIPQAEHFSVLEAPLRELRPGELLVRNDFLSIEPAMRGWVNTAANYADPADLSRLPLEPPTEHIAPWLLRRLQVLRFDARQIHTAARTALARSRGPKLGPD